MSQSLSMSRFIRTMGAAAVAVVAACDDPAPTAARRVAESPASAVGTVTTPAAGPWARIIEGETGPGSLYALHIPRDWNGDAIYYAHGFRDAASPVDLRDQDQLFAMRDELGARGFAVAYSSFSNNGFVVKDGVQRTHQLRGLLASALGGQPQRSFLAGHSLGGGIALAMAEKYPDQYDGALLLCGMVGGSRMQTQYLGDVRALADVFYPGRFPGNPIGVPDGTIIALNDVIAAVGSNPAGLFAIASTLQTPLPFVPVGNPADPSSPAFQTMLGSLYAALSFHARGINNVVGLVHGKTPYGNNTTVYGLGGAPVFPGLGGAVAYAENTVARFTMDESAASYLDNYFRPTGNLALPVLTIHNAWDPAVPMFHEVALRNAAIAAGAAGQLLQRTEMSFGHCNISAAKATQGLLDLVAWRTSGVKPAG